MKSKITWDSVNNLPEIQLTYNTASEALEDALLKEYIENATPYKEITPIVTTNPNGTTEVKLSLLPFEDLVVTNPILIAAIRNNNTATSLSNQSISSIQGLAIASEVNKFTHIQHAQYRYEGSEPQTFNVFGQIKMNNTGVSGLNIKLWLRNLSTNTNTDNDYEVFVPTGTSSFGLINFTYQITLNPGNIFTLGVSKETSGGGTVTVTEADIIVTVSSEQ